MQGYGVDTWCLGGLQSGRYARGRMLVAQALYRRLITPRGTLRGGPEEENYGIDLAGYCGDLGTDTAVLAIPAIVRAELLKDDRVEDVEVTASKSIAPDGLVSVVLTVSVRLANEDSTFDLTLGVSAVAVTLLGVTA